MTYDIEKNYLDFIELEEEKCIGCKLCMEGCPMLEKFTDNPKNLLKDLVREASYSHDLPYSCMLCGYCREVCPKDVDLNKVFMDLRYNTFKSSDGRLPKELAYSGVKFHQKNSFSNLFSSEIKNLDSKMVFFPGCSLLAYSPDIVDRTYDYLKELLPGMGIYINCCAKPSISMGDQASFDSYFSILEREFEAKGVDTVVTACLNCYKTFQENTDLKIVSLWEILGEKGIPEELRGIGRKYDLDFLLHDPCPTRSVDTIHQSIRSILDQLGFDYVEMDKNRNKTLCCGAGGMVGASQPDLAMKRKIERAQEKDQGHIVSYCEECVISMKTGGKKSIHILDLLFNEDIYEGFDQEDRSLIRKWINRYRARKKFSSQ